MDGTEKLHGQFRDAAQGGQREETEVDRAQNKARVTTQRALQQLGKLTRKKKQARGARSHTGSEIPAPPSDVPAPEVPATPDITQGSVVPARIKTKESARSLLSTKYSSAEPVRNKIPQIKTKDAQTDSSRYKKEDRPRQLSSSSKKQPSQPVEQGRQKFVREQQKKVVGLKAEGRRSPERIAPARQQGGGVIRYGRTSALSTANSQQPAGNAVREVAFGSKHRIKEPRWGTKAIGRTSRQTVKAAEAPRQVVQAGARSTKMVQQAARTTVQAQRRAVQAAGTAKRTVATVSRPVTKAAASALRGAVSTIRALAAPLAAAGGTVIPVVLVICMVGGILASPLGIFFGGTGGGADGETTQTIASAVREINQEYNDRVEALKTEIAYDELSLSGTRAVWPEVLAVYAVKATTDPINSQEVITMDNGKKELLKQVFWDMNELSSFTSTVPGKDGDEEDTTTLHITVAAKTADEMADVYGFNAEQRQQLAELLSDEYRKLWSAVLYGIGTGSSEIVYVALSQVGNVGGQPYWSWYGFASRVDWCAIFVSWCANECGYINAGVVPKFAGCVQGSSWFKDRGLWQDKSYTPNPGDVVFFDWDNPGGFSGPQDGVPDHVGIVERVENGRVYTVEGNSGDKCCQRSYPVGYYEIYGYGQIYP